MDTPAYYYSFYAPLSLALIFNMAIFLRSVAAIASHTRKRKKMVASSDSRKSNFRQLKTSVGLSFLLGLTWSVGFFMAGGEHGVWLQYVFVLLTTTQGVAIFLFQCVLRKAVRNCWKQTFQVSRVTSSMLIDRSISRPTSSPGRRGMNMTLTLDRSPSRWLSPGRQTPAHSMSCSTTRTTSTFSMSTDSPDDQHSVSTLAISPPSTETLCPLFLYQKGKCTPEELPRAFSLKAGFDT